MRSNLLNMGPILATILALAPVCFADSTNPTRAAPRALPQTVTVFAAASLTAPFQTIAPAFRQAHPDVRLEFNFAGSSTLARQILEGAPADVFASADEASLRALVESGATATPPRVFAGNALQIVVAPGNPARIGGLADLARPDLTIALCAPSVPCGAYAADAFARAGLAVPAASQELDVRAVLNRVALGGADAGVVYATDVRNAGARVGGVEIPESFNVVARYPIAALKSAAAPALAAAFVDFLLSPDGQRALAGFGFLPP